MTGWTITRSFESFDEFLDHLDANQPAWRLENCDTVTEPASDWNGNVTFAQAMDLARHGWPEGRDHMHEVSAEMTPDNIEVSAQITRQIDVAGAYPVVPLAIAGEPAHMVDVIEADTPSRIIRCVASISNAGMISAQSLTANGAATCSYIDALELAGWSCEIWVYFDSKADGNMVRARVCIKPAGQMLDLDRLAFALAHPAMLRRLMFRALEIEAKAERSHKGSYGHPATERPDDCQVYVGRLRNQVTSDEALARVADSFELDQR